MPVVTCAASMRVLVCTGMFFSSDQSELLMRTYYFEMKDGPLWWERVGVRFPTAAAAIEHGKQLARRLRGDPRIDDPNLYISVVDESGTELHREQVYKGSERHSGGPKPIA